jgi:hypothetical protein
VLIGVLADSPSGENRRAVARAPGERAFFGIADNDPLPKACGENPSRKEKEADMRSAACLLVFSLIVGASWGCSSAPKEEAMNAMPVAPVSESARMKVADVSNATSEVFDVDVIGLLWNGIDENLKNRGLLWTGPPSQAPYTLEAQIIRYQKGSIWLRNVLPMWGKTTLAVKCDLKHEGRTIASVESQHSISIGGGSLTFDAWRKVFSTVAEDIVNKLLKVV